MKTKTISIILTFLIVLGLGTVISKAAISGNSQTVNSGENVTITINSNQKVSSYKVSVTSDGGLTYVSCADSNNGQSGNKMIAGSPTNGATTLGTFTFKAPEVTTDTKYTVSFSATAMETPELEEVSDSNTSVTITVKAPEPEQPAEEPQEPEQPVIPTKSDNNYLHEIGIRPYDFTTFKREIEEYYVTVPYDVTQVEVYAVKEEDSQQISGTGYKSLNVGTNTLKVVCTAEDGTTRTYTMYVTREDEKAVEETPTEPEEPVEEEPTEEVPEETSNENTEATEEKVLGITSFNIVGKTENGETVEVELSPAFEENIYEYVLTVPLSVKDIEITAGAENEATEIEVMGNKNLVEGENSVTVIVKVGEETKVYQITVNKTAETGSALSNEVIMQLAIIAAIATIIIVAIIAIIIMIVRSKKKDKRVQRHQRVENNEYTNIDSQASMPSQENTTETEKKEE